MRLSKLQIYILKQLYWLKSRNVQRQVLYSYYDKLKKKPEAKILQDTVTQSLENLISKGLIAASGNKTAKKFYIHYVRLTPKGRKWVKHSLDKQKSLPFKARK